MAKTARQHVFDGMELLPIALIPFVTSRLEQQYGEEWIKTVHTKYDGLQLGAKGGVAWDQLALLTVMDRCWNHAFSTALGAEERSLVNELRFVKNRLEHDETFGYDDAERALDTMKRLMEAIGAGEAATQLGKMRETIIRRKFADIARNEERRKTAHLDLPPPKASGVIPWRGVVDPHNDVATGQFLQAEFAADLSKAEDESAPTEYVDPVEFYRRTHLTEGLSRLITTVAYRLAGSGGDPVVGLKTNFGGGKTHSMLALYHLASGISPADLIGLDELFRQNDIALPKKINRAVLVGTSRGPMDITETSCGRVIKTTWGHLAWQLGGATALDIVAECDSAGISPGSDLLMKLLQSHSPALILIDEWIAYLRQIYKVDDLPSGSFEANMTFVQSLTEAVSACPKAALVASLPASQIELGGDGGQAALQRLEQTFSRMEASWRPASQEESYEIVRRRLFQEIPSDRFRHRDNAVRQYAKLYQDQPNDFPRECSTEEYRRRLEKAYPIHPELFHQLDITWGSVERFQRTRGVLRLMAQVIHELHMNNDQSAMIMPGCLPIDSARVEPELLKYLDNNWQAVIAGDVDGVTSTPYGIDKQYPNIGSASATRRIARCIFLGTAPHSKEENRGLGIQRINLGVAQPGDKTTVFGDALRRLTAQATFLHSDRDRYWYSIAPSLNRIATDKAGRFEEHNIDAHIEQLLRSSINSEIDNGLFESRVICPESSESVPDDAEGVTVVVLGVSSGLKSTAPSDIPNQVKQVFETRGFQPRVNRNRITFIVPDSTQIDDLRQAVRDKLAWEEIVEEAPQALNLTHSATRQARQRQVDASEFAISRLKECWHYLVYPAQDTPQSDLEWVARKLVTQGGIIAGASKKMVSEESLLPSIGPERLSQVLSKYVWGESAHISLMQLWNFSCQYVYLPRLANKKALLEAVRASVSEMLPGPFAYSSRFDRDIDRYEDLVIDHGKPDSIVIDSDSVIVKPEIAKLLREADSLSDSSSQGQEAQETDGSSPTVDEPAGGSPDTPDSHVPHETPGSVSVTRFVGAVMVPPDRPIPHMNKIVEGIVELLTSPTGTLSIKIEIEADEPQGFSQSCVRNVTENAINLGFIDKDFK